MRFQGLILLFVTLVAISKPRAAATVRQSLPSPMSSAEDLLTTAVGANWTSYNGDYTGRKDTAV